MFACALCVYTSDVLPSSCLSRHYYIRVDRLQHCHLAVGGFKYNTKWTLFSRINTVSQHYSARLQCINTFLYPYRVEWSSRLWKKNFKSSTNQHWACRDLWKAERCWIFNVITDINIQQLLNTDISSFLNTLMNDALNLVNKICAQDLYWVDILLVKKQSVRSEGQTI